MARTFPALAKYVAVVATASVYTFILACSASACDHDRLIDSILSLSPGSVAEQIIDIKKIPHRIKDSGVKSAWKSKVYCGSDDSPLMLACSIPASSVADQESQVAVAAVMISCGADIQWKGTGGRTALVCAIESKNSGLVKLLLHLGSVVNVKYDCAIDGPSDLTPLHAAVQNNTCIDALIAGGADVNAIDSFGYSPLHQSALNENEVAYKRLIEAGARQIVSKYDGTPEELFARTKKARHARMQNAIPGLSN